MDEPKDRLKWIREQRGFEDATAAARRYSWNINTYRSHENGSRTISKKAAQQYASKFRMPAGWLLYAEGPAPTTSKQLSISSGSNRSLRRGVPEDAVVEADLSAGAGGGGLTSTELVDQVNGISISAEQVRDYWRLPEWLLRSRLNARPQHIVCFPTQGDSMSPTIADGDVVFVDVRHRVPSPPGVYVLADAFGGVIVKRLEVISKPRCTFMLPVS